MSHWLSKELGEWKERTEVIIQVYLDCNEGSEIEWPFGGIKEHVKRIMEALFSEYKIDLLKSSDDFKDFKDIIDLILSS